MLKIIAEISLPCDCRTMETAVLNAAHSGHHHDAQIALREADGKLIVFYDEPDKQSGKQ